MVLLASLNELSCGSRLLDSEIDQKMLDFVLLLRNLRRLRRDMSLVTAERLPNIELAVGYPMNRWAANGRNREEWQFLRRLQDRAPFSFEDASAVLEADECEYSFGGEIARGMGIAHSLEGIAISLPSAPEWDAHQILVDLIWIDQADEAVSVRHASQANHLNNHNDWLATVGLEEIHTGLDLWAARESLFPNLQFLPRTEYDLVNLERQAVRQVLIRLTGLQRAVVDWDPSSGQQPEWQGKVTSEHEGRRRFCEFTDLDDVVRVFDLHARFTPGPGRIHFRTIEAEKALRIAYIGRKLGA